MYCGRSEKDWLLGSGIAVTRYWIPASLVLSSTSKSTTSGVRNRRASSSRPAFRSTTERFVPPEFATHRESSSRVNASPQGSDPTPMALSKTSLRRSKTSSRFWLMFDR